MRIRRAAPVLAILGSFFAQATLVAPAQAQPAKQPSVSLGGTPKPPGHPAPSPKAPAKPSAKPAPPKPGKKGGKHAAARKPGEPGEPDDGTRRIIAGIGHGGRSVHESPELRAMRELDRALFAPASATAGAPWLAEGTPLIDRGEPEVLASGMPPESRLVSPVAPEPTRDLSWLRQLTMPDLPVRWDARVVRYLDFYKSTARGRSMVASWLKKSGRYGGSIRRILRENNLPEDIVWLALVESGFDPTIQSPAGAAGLWQFMPEGARIYGLAVDRWIDERLDPERSTVAAARYLTDLHTRFGSWELAFAAYNMGYGGLLASIRKYNTNDFWELSRLEAGMPLETALYVPKIVAMAIVARNRSVFGLDDVELDPAVAFDKIAVRPGVSLQSVALAAGTSTDKVAELNPQLTANRAPPGITGFEGGSRPAGLEGGSRPGGPGGPTPGDDAGWTVRVPVGTSARAAKSLPKFAEAEAKVERYVVRWGESVDEIATRRRTTRGMLASLNGLRREESMRPGTVLLVPAARAEDPADPYSDAAAGKPVVVVPAHSFAGTSGGAQRVFYRVVPGDTLRDVSGLFGVTPDEICRWNVLDPGAMLHDGMALQVYPRSPARPDVVTLAEKDAHVLAVGSAEFFAHFEGQRGRTRLELVAKQGDTWRTVAHHYGLSAGQLERINGKGRSSPLNPGDKLVVYVAKGKVPAGAGLLPAKPGKAPAPAPEEKAPEAVAMTRPNEPAADEAAARDDAMKPVIVPVALRNDAPAAAVGKGQAAANR